MVLIWIEDYYLARAGFVVEIMLNNIYGRLDGIKRCWSNWKYADLIRENFSYFSLGLQLMLGIVKDEDGNLLGVFNGVWGATFWRFKVSIDLSWQ